MNILKGFPLMTGRGPLVWMLSAFVMLGACDCSATGTSIAISSPTADMMIGPDADEDPGVEGLQFSFVASSRGLSADDTVQFFVNQDPESGAEGLMPFATATPDEMGIASVQVTLPDGMHTLVACARDCTVRSSTVTFSVMTQCAQVSWVVPAAPAAGEGLTLGPGDDEDGEACGETFASSVRVFTDAPEGGTAQFLSTATRAGSRDYRRVCGLWGSGPR